MEKGWQAGSVVSLLLATPIATMRLNPVERNSTDTFNRAMRFGRKAAVGTALVAGEMGLQCGGTANVLRDDESLMRACPG